MALSITALKIFGVTGCVQACDDGDTLLVYIEVEVCVTC